MTQKLNKTSQKWSLRIISSQRNKILKVKGRNKKNKREKLPNKADSRVQKRIKNPKKINKALPIKIEIKSNNLNKLRLIEIVAMIRKVVGEGIKREVEAEQIATIETLTMLKAIEDLPQNSHSVQTKKDLQMLEAVEAVGDLIGEVADAAAIEMTINVKRSIRATLQKILLKKI